MLWVELFDSTADSGATTGSGDTHNGERNLADSWITSATNALMNQQSNKNRAAVQAPQALSNGPSQPHDVAERIAKPPHQITLHEDEQTRHNGNKPLRPVTPYFLFLQENRDRIKADLTAEGDPTTKQLVQEGTRRWNAMPDKERQVSVFNVAVEI